MKLLKAFLVTAVALVALCAEAATWIDSKTGITWRYTVSSGKASVGGGSSSSPAVPQTTSGAITIPSTLGGYPVASIGNYAFCHCSSLTSVTIPNSVMSIGSSAFSSCTSLTNITIPNSVMSIGSSAFSSCTSLTNITIPNSITSIGDEAFSSCTSLTSIIIPDNITSLGSSVFSRCSLLESVVIGDGVPGIKSSTFGYCTSLKSVTLGNSVASIEQSVFIACRSLRSITIPSSVTDIARNAFYLCEELQDIIVDSDNVFYKSDEGLLLSKDGTRLILCPTGKTFVTIPASVTSIEAFAFSDCNVIQDIIVASNNTSYKATDGLLLSKDGADLFYCVAGKISVTIPEGVVNIGTSAFSSCSLLTSVTMPDSVTSIGSSSFKDCGSLTSVVIPNSVTNIGSSAFNGCSSLTNVTIGCGVTSIGSSSFEDCGSLTSVVIPNSVTDIGGFAFYECSSLTSVVIPNSVTNIGSYAFYNCSSLTDLTIPNNIPNVGMAAFEGCVGLADGEGFVIVLNVLYKYLGDSVNVVIPDCVTSIAIRAFNRCKFIKSITIPNSVTSIGSSAFSGCSSLESVTLPDGITEISSDLFLFCSSLKSVIIPDGVTSIGSFAFYHCYSLRDLKLPDTIKRIRHHSFFGCNLSLFDCETIPNVKLIDGWVVEPYGNAVGDLDLTGVKGIVEGAFANCSSLTSLIIPGCLETSGNAAFQQCTSLTNVIIQNGVSYVDFASFYNCTSLKNVTIPKSVTEIGDRSFEGCTSLTSITIPDSVEKIFADAFYFCGFLTNVVFEGNAPKSVGKGAFEGVHPDCTVYVRHSSTGWGVDIPGKWYGMNIDFLPFAIKDLFGGEWIEGVIGTGSVEIIDDISSESGLSVKFTAEDSSSVWIETTVTNRGNVSFNWKVSSEAYKFYKIDYASFSVDGEERAWIGGEVDWTNQVFLVEGEGAHVLRWTYTKDLCVEAGDDSVWLKDVVWMPIISIPELPLTATADEVAAALDGSADAKLAANIKTAAEYATYREWALNLEGVTPEEVKASPNAWLSYALNTDKLIIATPKEGDVIINVFESAVNAGTFEFTVKLDGIEVGENALGANLRKVFDIEGAETLANGGAGFSTDNVEVDAVVPENGNVKFTVTPKMENGEKPDSFFFRVKMK